MQTIKVSDGTELIVNESMSVGQTFRLIGRTITFRAVKTEDHKVAGSVVQGISICGKFRTAARVCDTAQS